MIGNSGTNAASGNRSGNHIYLNSGSVPTGIVIQNNFIGTNSSGANLGNALDGIKVEGGGADTITGNQIAYSGGAGIDLLSGSPTGISIRSNSIYSNAGLGIDLGNDGVTANDFGDGDTGPNNLQNFPVISQVSAGNTTLITGSLNSTPNTSFNLDFYASGTTDPTGYGEGNRLSRLNHGDDRSKQERDVLRLVARRDRCGRILLTATATDFQGNTSGSSP